MQVGERAPGGYYEALRPLRQPVDVVHLGKLEDGRSVLQVDYGVDDEVAAELVQRRYAPRRAWSDCEERVRAAVAGGGASRPNAGHGVREGLQPWSFRLWSLIAQVRPRPWPARRRGPPETPVAPSTAAVQPRCPNCPAQPVSCGLGTHRLSGRPTYLAGPRQHERRLPAAAAQPVPDKVRSPGVPRRRGASPLPENAPNSRTHEPTRSPAERAPRPKPVRRATRTTSSCDCSRGRSSTMCRRRPSRRPRRR